MELLYRDDRVLVCLKPPGLLSTDEPGGLPERLRSELDLPAVRGVHRLDRPVGGVMVYALTRRAASDLGRQMAEGRFHKRYLAIVRGLPEPDQGELRDWLYRDRAQRRTVPVPPGTEGGRPAALRYETLAAAEDRTLLAVELLTGRTHQIRCQLAARGWSIVGDRKYGPPETGAETLALWSCCLSFEHPRTGERLRFTRLPEPVPPWDGFAEGWEALSERFPTEGGTRGGRIISS